MLPYPMMHCMHARTQPACAPARFMAAGALAIGRKTTLQVLHAFSLRCPVMCMHSRCQYARQNFLWPLVLQALVENYIAGVLAQKRQGPCYLCMHA